MFIYELGKEFSDSSTDDDRSSDAGSIGDNFVDVSSVDNNESNIKIDNEWIFGCNRCYHCDKPYRHSKVITQYDNGLEEVVLRFSHPKCNKAFEKVEKLKFKAKYYERLAIDAEWEYFNLKYCKYFL